MSVKEYLYNKGWVNKSNKCTRVFYKKELEEMMEEYASIKCKELEQQLEKERDVKCNHNYDWVFRFGENIWVCHNCMKQTYPELTQTKEDE